jgi:two-component sensor histidine kinase
MKLFWLCFLLTFPCFAQKASVVDSLQKALLVPENQTRKSEIYQELADNYQRANIDSASKYAALALTEAQKSQNNRYLGMAYLQSANIWREKSQFEQAVKHYQTALTYFEKEKNQFRIGKTYNSMALTYKRMGDAQKVTSITQKGLSYSKKAIEILTSTRDSMALATAYNTQGIIYRDLKQFEKAKTALQTGLTFLRYQPASNTIEAIINANLGQIYMDFDKNYNAAIAQFQKALLIYPQFNDLNGMEHSYRNLSEAHRLKKLYPEAIAFGKKSVAIAEQQKDIHRRFNAHLVLYKAYEAANNYPKAFEYLKLSKYYEDSTLRAEKSNMIAEIETKFETEKKEIQIKSLSDKNNSQRNLLMLTALGMALLLGLLAVLYFQYQKIKESRAKISEQSDQLKLMMKELHHRVKNNLAIVSSLLKIQSNRIEDEKAVQAVRQGQQRVEAMSLIHQRLYQTDKVTNINIKEYINDLTDSLMHAYGYNLEQFDLELYVEQEELDVDTAMPIGLIINELLTNSFKYAYANTAQPLLKISLKNQDGLTLEVQDNGPGIDMEDWQKAKDSFGKKLITGLTKQIGGTMMIENREGSYFCLHIPKEKLKIAA